MKSLFKIQRNLLKTKTLLNLVMMLKKKGLFILLTQMLLKNLQLYVSAGLLSLE